MPTKFIDTVRISLELDVSVRRRFSLVPTKENVCRFSEKHFIAAITTLMKDVCARMISLYSEDYLRRLFPEEGRTAVRIGLYISVFLWADLQIACSRSYWKHTFRRNN